MTNLQNNEWSELFARLMKPILDSRKELLDSFPKISKEDWKILGFTVHCLTYGDYAEKYKANAIISEPTRCPHCSEALTREVLGVTQTERCWYSYFPSEFTAVSSL